MRAALPLVALVVLAGCSRLASKAQSPDTSHVALALAVQPDILCENRPFTDRDLSQASLDVLWYKLIQSPTTSEEIALARGKVTKLRTWAQSLDNARIRDAYVSWLDYYSAIYDTAEEALKLKQDPTENQYSRENRELMARAAALAKCLPVPFAGAEKQ